MNILIFSCSLSPTSHSAQMAKQLADDLQQQKNTVDFVDLRELELPFCNASSCYENAQVQQLQAKLQAADAVVVAVPIYNYGVGGVATNLMALSRPRVDRQSCRVPLCCRRKIVVHVGDGYGKRLDARLPLPHYPSFRLRRQKLLQRR